MSQSNAGDMPGEMLIVGKITGCYGIKGWVKVHSYTDPEENLLSYGDWHVRRRGKFEAIEIDSGRHHGKGLVAHITGVDDRTQAEAFKGLELWAPEAVLPTLEEGEYYWRQLQDLEVWCTAGDRIEGAAEDKAEMSETGARVLLGKVDHLIETGANDVLVVKPCEASLDDKERLIPYAPGEIVTGIDLDAGRMEVDWFVDED